MGPVSLSAEETLGHYDPAEGLNQRTRQFRYSDIRKMLELEMIYILLIFWQFFSAVSERLFSYNYEVLVFKYSIRLFETYRNLFFFIYFC